MKRLRALFIIVLICHVCAATEKKLNTARARFFTPSDFTSNNGRLEYEMTTVERVNRNGKRHSPHKHYFKYGHSGLKTGPLYYRLPAFGRNFNIRLRRDDSFVSPLFTVEHVFNDLRRLSFSGDLRHCFYRGDIHGDPNSTAVFNLCNGLRGSFVSNGERYFVEPVDEHKKNASINFRKFHIVFRRPTDTDSLSNGSTCGVQDSDMPRPLLRDRHPHHENMSKQIRRRKRSIDENFVETLVVADRTMVDAFKSKADLQSYILTLMGVVSQVYRDRTIGNPINIVVVKIAFLETNEPGIHISTDAARTLKSFCRWQKKVMTKDPKHPEHHDTAILLTKRNICRSPGRCDTLGLAELGTMCNPSRSCALVEDNGLSAAFTIAHELGHLFNLPHDGDNNPCTRSRGDQHIMARSLSFDNKPWSWSNCSRNKLTEFLDLGYGYCLEDKPDDKVVIKYKNQLPGEVYSIDKQCQMVFGENSSLCPFMEPCRRLWCVKMIGRRKGCSTHHMPWADGTPCAKRKWCIRGQCVKRRRLKPVDGQWGQWGPDMECTRKCGGGISFSYRKCNNPVPENGGKYCIGPRKRFKSCNWGDCPVESVDFRALQCVNTYARTVTSGSKSYRIKQWVPKYAGISKENQCKLYCRMAGTAIYFKLKDKVIDGTPCNQETTDICVDGKCMPAGCDRKLNSNKKADKCGVCDGDNSSCRRFSGTFNETRFGYNYIFTIPVESTDIVITQFGWKSREDSNYLALQSDSGQFLLNGGMVIGLGVRQFRAAGSKIWYSGSEKATEQIKIEGKTTEPIKVLVLEVGEVLPPNVHYSLNQKVAEPKKFVYKWDHLGPWTQCSSLCQGKRKRRPKCVRAIDGQQVSNSRCDQRTRPSSVTEECNISCRLRWDIEYTGKCSERCGPGYQTRILRCIRVISDSWGEVLDKHCSSSTKPPVIVPCTGTCEGTKWTYTEWSKCSNTCNGGRQFRRAECVDIYGVSLKDRDCRPSDKQALRRPCNTFICPWWTNGTWSSCSVTCGSGQRTRLVKCVGEQGDVGESLCNQRKKPATTKSCDLESCPYWFVGKWTDCSQSCDNGTTTRQVMCLSGGKVAKQVDDAQCSNDTRPQARKVCKIQDCETRLYPIRQGLEYYWRISMWTPCSVSCGEKPGTQYRDVECVFVKYGRQELVDEKNCAHTPKPDVMKECAVSMCTTWRHGSWGRCSRLCGNGVQLRVVKCTYENFKITDDKNCDLSSKPLNKRSCQIGPCVSTKRVPTTNQKSRRPRPTTTTAPTTSRQVPIWHEGHWSQCSVSCGEKPGTQYRDVECVFVKYGRQELVDEKNCAHTPKPNVMKECAVSMCTTWRHGSWGRCSRLCGNGVQLRVVKCTYENFKITDDKNCDLSSKPLNKRSCQTRPCVSAKRELTSNQKSRRPRPTTTAAPTTSRQVPIWHEGHWSQCSVTCGEGQRTREVICRFSDGRTSTECDGKTRPQSVMDCVLRVCPVWREEPWTECSVSCGQGFRQRNVDCRFRNGQISRGCSEKNKPTLKELCNVRPCPTWMVGDWGRCSVTCGSGVRQRTVECSDEDISCDAKTKPQTTAPCNRAVCPQWKTRSWGECSVSCGDGIRERNVYCSLQDGQLSPGCNEESKPAAREGCNIRPCPTWMTGDWGKCSVTCGSGIKQRSVECSDKDFSCDASTKPQTTEICDHAPCPLWTPGPWEECSVSCGEGIRQRSVACRLKNGQISPGCDNENKPPTKEGCNIRPCPTWMTGDWGKCSATCGAGVKQRSVECSDQDLSCDPKTKPESTAPCDLKACPQWTSSSWGRCSVSCGEGVRQRTVNCRLQDGRLSPGCDDKDKPAPREACNIRPCPAWMTGDWGECSVTCGFGLKRRSVECSDKDFSCEKRLKPQSTAPCDLAICPQWKTSDWSGCSVTCGNGFRRRTVRCTGDVSKCDYRSRPKSVERCNPGLCPTWIAGEWDKCSKTCGNGIKTRAVNCSGSQCDTKTKPASIAECHLGPCAEWKAGAWQQCSVTCGKGWRRRTVECTARNHRCDYRSKPDMYTMCDMGMCPMWRAGLWSKCSVTCGNGVKTRTLECTGGEGKCNPRTQPYSTSRCYIGSCPEWKVGGWSQCSVSCGSGIKKRPVKCSGRGTCDSRTQPQATTSCNLGLCPEWNVGVWSQCSVTCGSGLKQRNVTCSRSDVTCDAVTKPVSKTKCVLSACPVWKAGVWGQCSVTCGDGIKSRTVQCSGGPNNCDPSTKPETSTKCSLSSCPQWRVSQWSACSASCGEGVKERSVECRTENKKSSNCDPDIKPTERTSCNVGLCPHWKIGEWTQCSVTCGSGTKQRKIQCVSGVNATCDQRTKPVVTENCNLGQCPMWYTGRWTQCSRTCGSGIRRRAVACFSMITRKRLQDSACNVTLKPAGQEDCTVRECFPQARWRKGEWSKCSVYCGLGGKTRDVWCSTKDGTRVPDVHCASERKPRTQRPCNKKQRCGEWEVGLWTECSATCGEGTRERAIRCLHALEYKGLTFCDHNTRPADRQACNKGTCPATPNLYHWETSAWTECSNSCGYGRNSRDVWCVDSFKRNVSDALCNPASKPENATLCHGSNCPSKWKHGDWSRCSTTCGRGYQLRTVECVGNTECDRRTRPPSWRLCNMGNCYGFLFWRVGPWSPHCSVSCGRGIVKRAVRCLARNGTYADDSFCATPSSSKPETSRVCQMKPCPPTSCKEVQSISGLQTDGEQTLMVQGKELQVYCHKMMSAEPKEYITLKTGPDNNFAEFYPKRLRNARECPSNGSHFEECNCEDEDYRMSGGSYFSKVRLDLSSMRIITEDRTFASTRGLNPPAYATAGDCYSAQGECPQGRFSINLRETGIRLTSKVMWGSTGQAYYQIIYRYPEGFEVIGKCGGRCGSCSPEADVGLLVELADDVS